MDDETYEVVIACKIRVDLDGGWVTVEGPNELEPGVYWIVKPLEGDDDD